MYTNIQIRGWQIHGESSELPFEGLQSSSVLHGSNIWADEATHHNIGREEICIWSGRMCRAGRWTWSCDMIRVGKADALDPALNRLTTSEGEPDAQADIPPYMSEPIWIRRLEKTRASYDIESAIGAPGP